MHPRAGGLPGGGATTWHNGSTDNGNRHNSDTAEDWTLTTLGRGDALRTNRRHLGTVDLHRVLLVIQHLCGGPGRGFWLGLLQTHGGSELKTTTHRETDFFSNMYMHNEYVYVRVYVQVIVCYMWICMCIFMFLPHLAHFPSGSTTLLLQPSLSQKNPNELHQHY